MFFILTISKLFIIFKTIDFASLIFSFIIFHKFLTMSKLPEIQPKPFLRWAGSKKQLLPVLSKYWTGKHKRYVEPFAGSACLFFHLKPKYAILGDINQELIETYQQVKQVPEKVISNLKQFQKGKEAYYNIRSIEPTTLTKTERAARFIYLNRYCFNGLYRTNRKGKFNVPYGGEKAGNIPSDDIIYSCSELLTDVILIGGDFEDTLSHATHEDFVYMDPPYRVNNRRVFNEYDALTFTQDDLKRLRSWIIKLTDKGVVFLLSYAYCDEANYLQDGFQVEKVSVKRNIAGFSKKRRNDYEVLITNKNLIHYN